MTPLTGYRLYASSIVPITNKTLRYGSANAGATVLFDKKIHELLLRAGKQLNIKEHQVADAGGIKDIVGPADIEVR